MHPQLTIDWNAVPHRFENNNTSQNNLEGNIKHFSRQCKILYDGLMKGEIHNGDTAKDQYGIRDMIRRYHDLLDGGIKVSHNTIPNSHGMIEIYMSLQDRKENGAYQVEIRKRTIANRIINNIKVN